MGRGLDLFQPSLGKKKELVGPPIGPTQLSQAGLVSA